VAPVRECVGVANQDDDDDDDDDNDDDNDDDDDDNNDCHGELVVDGDCNIDHGVNRDDDDLGYGTTR